MATAVLESTDVPTLRRRAAIASTIGTSIEWYDFFLYNTASAAVFPELFFPSDSPIAGVLKSFSIQFVGFAARPIGAAIFGHLGDRIGRKSTLIATLVLMGIGTALIGVLPTFHTLGAFAAVLLVVLRLVQGIGVGGEWGGSVLLAMEWGNQRKRGFWASWPQLGVPIGLLLSTGAFKLMGSIAGSGFNSWGWRVPFLVSVVLVAVGLYVRLRVKESPQFDNVRATKQVVRMPLWESIRRHPREILCSMFVRMSEQAPFYLFTVFVLTYGTEHLKLANGDLLVAVMIAAAVGLVSVPLFGWLSDRIGRRLMYGIGIVATAAFAFPYFGLLDTKVYALVLVAIVVSLIFHDMQYGPQAALIAESFGTNVRYSGASLGYQFSSVIAGGPAPLIAAAILGATGKSTWIAWYIVGCAVLAMIALIAMPRKPADTEVAEATANST